MFNAILIERDERPYRATLTQLEEARLPAGEVTVRVDYSTLNYKAVSYTHLTLPTIYSV